MKLFPLYLSVFLLFLSLPLSAAASCKEGRLLYDDAMETTDLAQKISLLESSDRKCRNFRVLFALGGASLQAGDADAAAQWFSEAALLEKDPEFRGNALVGLAKAYEKQDRLLDAASCYRRVWELGRETVVASRLRKIEPALSRDDISAEVILRSLQSDGAALTRILFLPIRFPDSTNTLSVQAKRQLDALGGALSDRSQQETKLLVVGHSDSRGPAAYNMMLSKQRAEQVKQYLVANFPLSTYNITVAGRGEEEPLYAGEDAETHYLNRRVEFRLE